MDQYGSLSSSLCFSDTFASYDLFRESKCESYIFIKL